jgi:hypothetical protein
MSKSARPTPARPPPRDHAHMLLSISSALHSLLHILARVVLVQGEISLRRRHSTGDYGAVGRGGAEKLHLTSDMYTQRTTGRSEVCTSFEPPAMQPWMRGNTKRFGNTGPWVSNRAPAIGAAPSVRVPAGGKYLAGTRSVSNETYRLPYGSDPSRPSSREHVFNMASTLRIGGGQRPGGARKCRRWLTPFAMAMCACADDCHPPTPMPQSVREHFV